MESVYSCLDRSLSVSSMRNLNSPPKWRARSQQKMAVRPPPICKCPVGLGAKRVMTFFMSLSVLRVSGSRPAKARGRVPRIRPHDKASQDAGKAPLRGKEPHAFWQFGQ